ncbi:MAG: hypothetical protein KBA66_18850 [Leptospiraceae bacterium]|nr:hypothetical protein [Leptospiraceae bacterium]
MQEEYTPEKIIEIINSAADASLEASLASKAEQKKARQGFSEKEISKILDSTSNEIVRREEVDYLATQIKNRFAKIKSISKENFNMFEVAMQCHRLVNDYRQLAREKGWKEIEAMFSRKENS